MRKLFYKITNISIQVNCTQYTVFDQFLAFVFQSLTFRVMFQVMNSTVLLDAVNFCKMKEKWNNSLSLSVLGIETTIWIVLLRHCIRNESIETKSSRSAEHCNRERVRFLKKLVAEHLSD